jgi:phosphatidylglycerol:prolipoprotein diacylglycerol transferase
MSLSVITIRLAPVIHLGPLTIAWHGLTIAIGIVIGALLAGRLARSWGLSSDPLYTISGLIVLGALVGGRLFYLLERDPGGLVESAKLFSGYGYTFDGGVILAGVLIVAYIRRQRLTVRYLDVVALGLPLGVAIGRIGDVINGEHYGARSDSFLAVRNANPEAKTPNPHLAYQNGGLYEVLLATIIFAVVWPLRNRLRRPTDATWLVLGLFAAGRFFEFFLRSDSPQLALGLNNAQWTSIALLAFVLLGWSLTRRRASSSAPSMQAT